MAYITIMAVLVLSFSVALFVGFGENEKNFNTYASSLLSLCDLLFGNFNAATLEIEDGLLVTTLILMIFTLLTFLSMSAMLAVINWASREVQEGKVFRETDDLDSNLKRRLQALLVRLMSSKWFFFISRSWVEKYIKGKTRQAIEEEQELEEELLLAEQREIMMLARSSLRNLIQSVSQLRTQTKTLQAEFNIRDVGNQDWAQFNAWRKLRNHYQQLMFQNLIEHIKTGDKDAVER